MIVNGMSVDDAWKFLAALGAGVGLVFILRWFWWRINAWSEIAAMVGSLGFFAAFQGLELHDSYRGLLVALCCLALWLLVTLVTKPEGERVLTSFYRKVRPDGPGWGPIARLAPEVRRDGLLGRGIVCALLGTAVIWLTLPGIGAVIFGAHARAAMLLGGAAVALALLFRTMQPLLAAAPVSPRK